MNLTFRSMLIGAAMVLTPLLAHAQSSPGLYTGQVPTAAQWNSYFAAKQDALGYTPLNQAGGYMAGPLVTYPSASLAAGLNIPPGVAPNAPNSGDLWMTQAGGLYYQYGSTTIGPLVGAEPGSFAGTAPVDVTFPGNVTTYALNYDSNFATVSSNLAFAPIASGDLLGNCTGSSSEPTGCSWNSFASQAIGSTNGIIPYVSGGAWGTISTGTSGATLGLLNGNNTYSGSDTFSDTLNCTGTCELSGAAFGTFATQNYATPPAIGGTTPAAGSFSPLTDTGLVAAGAVCNSSAGLLSTRTGICSGQSSTGSGPFVLATSPSISSPTVISSFTATGLVTNGDLANPSTTVNGQTCTLGSTCTITAPDVPNASGSNETTTGSISSSSPELTLAAAEDFADGEGVIVAGAGPTYSLNAPTNATVIPEGATGSTTYNYQISAIDCGGGVGVSIATFSTSTGNAALSLANYNRLTWTAPTGTAPCGYAVFGNTSASMALLGLTYHTSFDDYTGYGTLTSQSRPWAVYKPLTSAQNDYLKTTISSGAGTTSLILADAASNTVAGAAVWHDDTAALQAAIGGWPSYGGKITLLPGVYNISAQLVMGNGASGSLSTISSFTFSGLTNPISSGFLNGDSYPTASSLNYDGPPLNGGMIKIAGPLEGFEIDNLQLNCEGVGDTIWGLQIVSGSYGGGRNLAFTNCGQYDFSENVVDVSGLNTSNLHNHFENMLAYGVTNDTDIAYFLSGDTTNDTDYNTIKNFYAYGSPNLIGLDLQAADSNLLEDYHYSAGGSPLLFDYSINSNWPASNSLVHFDPGVHYQSIFNQGTPSASFKAFNYISSLVQTNGGKCPSLSNLICNGIIGTAPTVSSCGTAPVVGAGSTNSSGQISQGTGSPTTCTVSFTDAFTNTPFCTVTPLESGLGTAYYYFSSGPSTTGFTVTGGGTSDKFQYTCSGS